MAGWGTFTGQEQSRSIVRWDYFNMCYQAIKERRKALGWQYSEYAYIPTNIDCLIGDVAEIIRWMQSHLYFYVMPKLSWHQNGNLWYMTIPAPFYNGFGGIYGEMTYKFKKASSIYTIGKGQYWPNQNNQCYMRMPDDSNPNDKPAGYFQVFDKYSFLQDNAYVQPDGSDLTPNYLLSKANINLTEYDTVAPYADTLIGKPIILNLLYKMMKGYTHYAQNTSGFSWTTIYEESHWRDGTKSEQQTYNQAVLYSYSQPWQDGSHYLLRYSQNGSSSGIIYSDNQYKLTHSSGSIPAGRYLVGMHYEDASGTPSIAEIYGHDLDFKFIVETSGNEEFIRMQKPTDAIPKTITPEISNYGVVVNQYVTITKLIQGNFEYA